ncbi:Signal transduction histidine kinase [Amycolatopsis arida]|uniref:histidine kinase n=1 Tax=Amycolatopsis arida TaxID=587909 RepID=A0A1I6AL42_9PSEU|nr:histidine kinase [Amycolatopsis arida]TDX87366.1 signal transduction histidine kinase [Amycolatopsis arida]SFQ69403.1 Signal transduction histidine kinase [Amycolatopsis arida]
MLTTRQPRVFGVPVVPMRLAPLVVVPAVLTLLTSPYLPTTAVDWVLSMSSAALFVAGGRWPLPVAVGQSALFAAVTLTGALNSFVVPGLAAVALVEVAMRRREALPVVVGGSAWAGAVLVGLVDVLGGLWTVATLLRLVLLVGGPILLGRHLRSLRELAATYHEQALAAERRRATETRQARTEERMAIARELHDLVAHHVASLVLRVGVARHVVPELDPRVARVLDDVHATGTSALADLRRLVAVLRDPASVEVPLVEPGDLAPALDAVLERTRRAGHPVLAEIDAEASELDAVRRLAVLRVVQEGLTNVLRHAGPGARVRVAVRRDAGDTVSVEIDDDGAGATVSPGDGHGLVGMRERVELVGGTLTAGPAERGWRVRAVLPPAPVEAAR